MVGILYRISTDLLIEGDISMRANVCMLYEGEGAVWMVRGMAGVCCVVVVMRLAFWLWK